MTSNRDWRRSSVGVLRGKWKDRMERSDSNTLLLTVGTSLNGLPQKRIIGDKWGSCTWFMLRVSRLHLAKCFLGAHKCRRTCCDWHEASGLSSQLIYVISVLQTGGAMRSLEWSTLFGLTACSQAADSFWAQDVWVTRHNSGQRENRAFKISA